MKRCSRCGVEKSFTDFHIRSLSRDGCNRDMHAVEDEEHLAALLAIRDRRALV